MEEGRGRRNASRKEHAKSAVEALKENRVSGKKRIYDFNVAEEENVYDVVDEDKYAQIAQRRRIEAVDFIEDDQGDGLDLGDDDMLFYGDPAEGEGEEDEEDGKKGQKGKKDAAGKDRIQKLFAAAATKKQAHVVPASVQKANNEEADALLEDILGAAAPAAPAANPFARPGPQAAARPLYAPAPTAPAPSKKALATAVLTASAPAVDAKKLLQAARKAAPPARPVPAAAAEDAVPIEEAPFDYECGGAGDYDAAPNPASEPMDVDAPPAPLAPSPAKPTVRAGPAAAPATAAAAAPAEMVDDDMAAGWEAILHAAPAPAEEPAEEAKPSGEVAPLPLTEAGLLPFFFLDALEEPSTPGTIYLFGKTPVPGAPARFESCCAVVKGMYRSIYVVPTASIFEDEDGEIRAMEEQVASGAAARGQLMKLLHERAAPLKAELAALLKQHEIAKYTVRPVKRNYAFEDPAIPHGEQWVLKVKYVVQDKQARALPLGLKGEYFAALLGTNQSLLEALLLKRKFEGPGWIALKDAAGVEATRRVSWCKQEVALASPKEVLAGGSCPKDIAALALPPLTVAGLHVKTFLNAAKNSNEIISAALVHVNGVRADGPTTREEWSRSGHLRHVAVLSRLDGRPFPPGFEVKAKEKSASLSLQQSERGLLSFLMAQLTKLDPDVIVGHNVGGYDLDVLLHRMQVHKLANWSRVGRLKRTKFPHLGGGGNVFGGGASQGVLACLAGRLLVDTYVSSRELVHEIDYSLTTLARELMGEHRSDIPHGDIPRRFAACDDLLKLSDCTSQDAWLSLALCFHLSVLPLTLQLTQLSGSVWNRTLQGQRAQRIEMLLLHDFYRRKFLLPDKLTLKDKARLAKRDEDEGGGDDDEGAAAPEAKGSGPRRKKAAYAGGLVLEPKKGLYNHYVLMLDFNSLYPSIIQEFNICFTTVERTTDGGVPNLPPAPADFEAALAPLPTVIRRLVQRRRQVKEQIKRESDPIKRQQLDIRQQALKLTANSMYGCLGFANSRFFARPLAELITHQGREILQSTVNLVEGTVGLEVVYGDTDSIFINTKTADLDEARLKGAELKKVVNKRFRLLEMELDAIFKSILLLKKKKYAAIKVEISNRGERIESMEQKGLDIVRRDWCPLAKECGNFALERILSGGELEASVAEIHGQLETTRTWLDGLYTSWEDMRKALPKFLIFKQLTKRPDEYPDAKNQPHVQVALRRKAQGKRDCVNPGDTVPYLICTEVDAEGKPVHPESKGLAERAFHIEEARASNGRIRPDLDYYLAQQVHPVVSRLCAHLEGTDASRLAMALGLDAGRFRGQARGHGGEDEGPSFSLDLDEEAAYQDWEPLMLRSPAGKAFEFQGVVQILRKREEVQAEAFLRPPPAEGAGPEPPLHPAALANQITMRVRSMLQEFAAGELSSADDGLVRTRQVAVRKPADGEMGTAVPLQERATGGRMLRPVHKAAVYKGLKHLKFLLDYATVLQRVPKKEERAKLEGHLQPIRGALDEGLRAVDRYIKRSDFAFVRFEDLVFFRPPATMA